MKVLVLGATSDIARAFVGQLAQRGDKFLLASRDVETLTRDANDLQIRTQAEVGVAAFDALRPETHADFLRAVLGELEHLDGVIVAFGYLGDQAKAQADPAEAARIIDVNYRAAVAILEPLAAHLEKRGSGWIFGLSSVAGVRGRLSNYVYGSAKAAFTIYLEGLAHRLAAKNVQVKIAKLGFVASKMTRGMPMPKWAVVTPEDAAKGLLWLLRSKFQSAYIPWRWWPIMTLIRALPASLFNKTKL